MKKTLMAFLSGMREFQLTYTTNYNNIDLNYAYDWGREWAHRLTFRRFEPQSKV